MLAQHTNSQAEHWFAIKRVLRYLSGTSDLALVYTQTGNPPWLLRCWLGRWHFWSSFIYWLWLFFRRSHDLLEIPEAMNSFIVHGSQVCQSLRSRQGSCLLAKPNARNRNGEVRRNYWQPCIIYSIWSCLSCSDEAYRCPTPFCSREGHIWRIGIVCTHDTYDYRLTKALPHVSHERCLGELGL